MCYHINYHGELFISDKPTIIQALDEFKKFRNKITSEKILFFDLQVEEK